MRRAYDYWQNQPDCYSYQCPRTSVAASSNEAPIRWMSQCRGAFQNASATGLLNRPVEQLRCVNIPERTEQTQLSIIQRANLPKHFQVYERRGPKDRVRRRIAVGAEAHRKSYSSNRQLMIPGSPSTTFSARSIMQTCLNKETIRTTGRVLLVHNRNSQASKGPTTLRMAYQRKSLLSGRTAY